jgi:NTE family protein
VLGSLVGAVALLVAFGVRSARHPVPAVDLRLFRVRSFSAANAGNLVFSLGFYALLLCNVLFLTGVWAWSTLHAGLALTPGPLTAAVLAPFAGRISDRYGQRVVAAPGGLLFAAGAALLAVGAPEHPDYLRHFLPAAILTGAGVGLSVSSLGSAAVAELPRTMFATGSAVTTCIRQIGAVLGIAVLLVILGDVPSLPLFEHAWWAMAATGAASGLCALALGRVRARDVDSLDGRSVSPALPAAAAFRA